MPAKKQRRPRPHPHPLQPRYGILARTFAELAPRCQTTLGPNWNKTRSPSSSSTSASPPPADPSPTEPTGPANPSGSSDPPSPVIPADSASPTRPSLPTTVSTNLTPTLGNLTISSGPNDPINTPILVDTTDSSSASQTKPGLKRSSSNPTLSSSTALTATAGALTELLQATSNLISPSTSGLTTTAGPIFPEYTPDSDPDAPASPSFVPSGKYVPKSKRPSLRPSQLPSPAHPHPERTSLPTGKPNCPFIGSSPPPFPTLKLTLKSSHSRPQIPPRPDSALGFRPDEDGAKTPTQENPYPFPGNLKENIEEKSCFEEDDYIEDDGEWKSEDGSSDSDSGLGEFAGGFYVGDDGRFGAIGDDRLGGFGSALGGDGYKDVGMNGIGDGGFGGFGRALKDAGALASMSSDSSGMALGGWTWEKHRKEWEMKDREDAELARAIENSKHEVGGVGHFGGVGGSGWMGGSKDVEMSGMSEEEQLAMAIELSKREMWGTDGDEDEDVDMDATPTQENPNPFGGFGNGGRGRVRTMERTPRSLLFDDNAGGLDTSQLPSLRGIKNLRAQEQKKFMAGRGEITPRQAAGPPRMKASSSGGSAMARQPKKLPGIMKSSSAGGEAMARRSPGPSRLKVSFAGGEPMTMQSSNPSGAKTPPAGGEAMSRYSPSPSGTKSADLLNKPPTTYQSPYPPRSPKLDKAKGKVPVRPGLTRSSPLKAPISASSSETTPEADDGNRGPRSLSEIDLSALDLDRVRSWMCYMLTLNKVWTNLSEEEAEEVVKKWTKDGWALKFAGEWDLKEVWGEGMIARTIWVAKNKTNLELTESDIARMGADV